MRYALDTPYKIQILAFSSYANGRYNYSGPMKTQLSICIEYQYMWKMSVNQHKNLISFQDYSPHFLQESVTENSSSCPESFRQEQKMFSCLLDRICTSCKIQNSLEGLIIPYLKVSHMAI